MSQPEPQLISACLAGDADSIARLVEQFQQRVFSLAWKMLGDRHLAEDVTQETFVRAIRSLSRWDSTRRFEPWLLAIAANRCRTQLARRRLPLVDCPEAAEAVEGAKDNRFESRQLALEIDKALGEIRPEYAQAFRLFHEQHLAYADIADELDVPLGTVKTWVHRARKEVATRLLARGVVDPVEVGLEPVNEESETNRENSDALRTDRIAAQRVAG